MSAGRSVDGEPRKVRVAVVGTGEFGRNHARVYRELEHVEFAGVFDQDGSRARDIDPPMTMTAGSMIAISVAHRKARSSPRHRQAAPAAGLYRLIRL